MKKASSLGFGLSVILALTLAGCGRAAKNTGSAGAPQAAAGAEPGGGEAVGAKPLHSHEGWWCGEHGVPEDICAQCNSKVAADFKAKGDWCKEHDLPESQCFVCHPEEAEKFAAQYEAKYGKRPPERQRGDGHGDELGHGA